MDESVLTDGAAGVQHLPQRTEDEACPGRAGYPPADDPPDEYGDNVGHVDEAPPRGDIGEIPSANCQEPLRERLQQARGVELRYLPSHKQVLAKLKALLRRAAARTVDSP